MMEKRLTTVLILYNDPKGGELLYELARVE